MACGPDPAANLRRQVRLIRQVARRGARIVCTQELFRTQYFCQAEDYRFFETAESIPGPTTGLLSRLARQLGIVIVAGLFERRARGVHHNAAAVIDADGTLLGAYRKMHIPDDPLYYEKFYFAPGDTGFKVWPTRYGPLGVLICWDQWFPEAARLAALGGAEILLYPTAIGWHPREKAAVGKAQHESWEMMQRSHAVANGCFVCAANRVGRERVLDAHGRPVSSDGIEFWGQSFVAGPDGQVIARASATDDQVLVADCDLSAIDDARTHWPFLRDRRIDAYGELSTRLLG
jgi:N-carbamoylputrescine amidase